MKKIICMFLLCAVLFSLSGCSMTKEYIPEIIENYDKYAEALSDKGIECKVEDSKTKSCIYRNDSGKVLTVFSPDGRQYVFYNIDKSNMNYPSSRGDACQMYWEGNCTMDGNELKYDVSICIQFRNKKTNVGVDHNNLSPSTGRIDNYSGFTAYNYLDGDFTPDFQAMEEKKGIAYSTKFRKADYWVKYFVSAEELSAYYNQACEYYEILCSVVED